MEGQLLVQFQEKLRSRSIITIQGLVIAEPGALIFEIRVGDNVVGTWGALVSSVGQVATVPPPALT